MACVDEWDEPLITSRRYPDGREKQSNHPINHVWARSDRRGARGGGGEGYRANNSRVDLITYCDAYTLMHLLKWWNQVWLDDQNTHEEEEADLNVKCVYQIPVSLEVPRIVKELLFPN